jgi:hypothetical protein
MVKCHECGSEDVTTFKLVPRRKEVGIYSEMEFYYICLCKKCEEKLIEESKSKEVGTGII